MLEDLIKPPKLNPGDKIATISLSWGGPGAFSYRYEIGKKRLETIFGLEVVHTKHALKDADWLHNNPKVRAEDLMDAFLDPSIKGIFSTVGGDEAIRLLPYVDLEVIRKNPKIFLGYSDTTVNHFMCLKAGLRSFYGPAVMTAFAENVEMHSYSIEGIKRVLFLNEIIGDLPYNKEGWTKEYLEWSIQANQNSQRHLNPPVDWNFVGACKELGRGRLIGGCVEVLQMLNGTSLWPECKVWENSILFLETSEEGMSVDHFRRFLRNLGAQGILESINGLLFSKPGGSQVHAPQFVEYENAILTVLKECNLTYIPVVTNMDFGHSDPQWTLPYGCLAEINPIERKVTLLESGVR